MFPVRQVLSVIDRAKNQGIDAPAFQSNDYFDDVVGKVYRALRGAAGGGQRHRLRRPAAVDADAGAPAARRPPPRSRQRFDHVLVDEFQDTNSVAVPAGPAARRGDRQHHASSATRTSRSTAGGAPTSATSSTSSATTPGAKVVKLEQNYRSTGNILRAANAIIAKQQRAPAEAPLHRRRATAIPIVLFEGETERDEAEFVAARIEAGLSAARAPRDFAVFYRTNAQSRVLEDALRARNLPYSVVGGTRFFDRAEIKDLIAYLRGSSPTRDDVAVAAADRQRPGARHRRGHASSGLATSSANGSISALAGAGARSRPTSSCLSPGAAQEGRRLRRADAQAARRRRGRWARRRWPRRCWS